MKSRHQQSPSEELVPVEVACCDQNERLSLSLTRIILSRGAFHYLEPFSFKGTDVA